MMQPSILRKMPVKQPGFIEPMQCKLVDQLPEGEKWLYELKFDGYRAIAIKNGAHVDLRSRNDKNLNRQYPEIIDALQELPQKSLVVDGEVVALDSKGLPSFQLLQNMGWKESVRPIYFYAFDLLNYERRELCTLELENRKELLDSMLQEPPERIRFSRSLAADRKTVIREIRKFGLEGIVAKQKRSSYEPGERTGAWVKYKLDIEQEFVVGGYRPSGVKGTFDLLLIGYFQEGKLYYSAKLKAGFTPHAKKQICKRFENLVTTKCPFVNVPEGKGGRWGESLPAEELEKCIWLKPKFIVQVRFTEWTSGGHLRHPKFVGLREDKNAKQVVREVY
jgi:bifunctional non-homologous end joining protein LigD